MTKRMMTIVGAAALFSALFAQADLITPSSIIARSEDTGGTSSQKRLATRLLEGTEMSLTPTGGLDADNPDDWQCNPSGGRFGNGTAWSADSNSETAQWVIIDLGATYDLGSISIWNMNPETADATLNRSAKTVYIYYALDRRGDGNTKNNDQLFSNTGGVWANHTTGKNVTKNTYNQIVTSPNAEVDMSTITARYIALDFTAADNASKLDQLTVQELQVFEAMPPQGTVIFIQ